MKICGAPIEANPCLFTWNIFRRYADLMFDWKPNWETFRAIESQTDKEEVGRFLNAAWDAVSQQPPISACDNLDWVVKLKYFSWVCAFDKDLHYIEEIWQSLDLSFNDSERNALTACQLAESAFYKNMTGRKNTALATVLDELLLPCIQISKDILKYLDDNSENSRQDNP